MVTFLKVPRCSIRLDGAGVDKTLWDGKLHCSPLRTRAVEQR